MRFLAFVHLRDVTLSLSCGTYLDPDISASFNRHVNGTTLISLCHALSSGWSLYKISLYNRFPYVVG